MNTDLVKVGNEGPHQVKINSTQPQLCYIRIAIGHGKLQVREHPVAVGGEYCRGGMKEIQSRKGREAGEQLIQNDIVVKIGPYGEPREPRQNNYRRQKALATRPNIANGEIGKTGKLPAKGLSVNCKSRDRNESELSKMWTGQSRCKNRLDDGWFQRKRTGIVGDIQVNKAESEGGRGPDERRAKRLEIRKPRKMIAEPGRRGQRQVRDPNRLESLSAKRLAMLLYAHKDDGILDLDLKRSPPVRGQRDPSEHAVHQLNDLLKGGGARAEEVNVAERKLNVKNPRLTMM
ncbi:hypothetical protein FB451DRAFT_1162247 [Mycena latifolia]|nr:hypothetical protein FB451DRAFT_1162247 [Mycena latifolia]